MSKSRDKESFQAVHNRQMEIFLEVNGWFIPTLHEKYLYVSLED
jgi:hypothetical protein